MYLGVGLPEASQGRWKSSREKAVCDVGISVRTGGCDTEQKQTQMNTLQATTKILYQETSSIPAVPNTFVRSELNHILKPHILLDLEFL